MTPHDLEDVEILELSLVDSPANQHASVVLCKASGYKPRVKPETSGETEKGDVSVTVEELTQKLEALQTQVADLTKKAADAETAAETLVKSAEDAGLEIEDGKIVKRADPEYVEIDGEKVEKTLVPAPLLKALEKQAAEIAKMKAQAEEVELAKRGEAELPNLAGTALVKGRLLAIIGKDEDLLKSLKAADAAMATQFVEKGHARVEDEASASYKLDQLAKAHASAQNVTYHAAYAEVTKSGVGADLLAQMRNEAN
jgi:hypothetical protein